MPKDNQSVVRRMILFGILVFVLIICLLIYSTRNNPFAPTEPDGSFSPQLTNPELLQNWLPSTSYKYTITGIDNYLQANRILASTLTINSKITLNESTGGSYDFSLLIEPQNQTHQVSVMIYNISGDLSTTVAIDGQQQGFSVPTSNASGTQYNGIDGLVAGGLTSLQAQELQSAFQKFDPRANSVSVNKSSIVLPRIDPTNPSLVETFAFLVNISGTNYRAKLNAIGLIQIELFLTSSQSNTQVFDSGVIGQT